MHTRGYRNDPVLFDPGEDLFRISDYDPWYEDKIVIQLFEGDQLLDERVTHYVLCFFINRLVGESVALCQLVK